MSERHANRIGRQQERPICPHVRSLWMDGYTTHQIARMTKRSLVDVKLMTEMLPPQGRVSFDANVLRKA